MLVNGKKFGVGFSKSNTNKSPLTVDFPLTSTSETGKPNLPKGIGPVTFTRASKQYVTDHEGVIRPVYDGSAAIEGSRVVTNLCSSSENLMVGGWNVVANGGSKTATTITTGTSEGYILYEVPNAEVGKTYRLSLILKGIGTSVGKTIKIWLWFLGGTVNKTIILSANETVYSITATPSAVSSVKHVRIDTTATSGESIYISKVQIEDITAQSNQNPGEYIPTTSAPVSRCFDYLNPYTVDSNGVVTDSGTRTPISNIKGILLEPARTNKVTAYGVIPGDTDGTEKITNGTFTTWSGDNPTGWTISSEDANNYITQSGNAARIVSNGSFISLAQGVGIIGRMFRFSVTVSARSSGTLLFMDGVTQVGSAASVGTFTGAYIAGSTTFEIKRSTACDMTVSNVSVKEVILATGTKASSLNATAITGMTLSGFTQTTGNLVVGAKYKINARTTLDFTTCGAANNNAGTVFTATVAGALGAGDSVDNQSVSLSIVDDTAALQAAGLLGVNPSGKAYKLDNSLGATSIYAASTGQAGNTNPVSGSNYAKGEGNLYLSSLSSTLCVINSPSSYIKNKFENITPASTDSIVHRAAAQKIVYFLLPQLEEGPNSTSIIPTSGASATRSATVLSIPTAGNVKDTNQSILFDISTKVLQPAGSWIQVVEHKIDTNNRWSLLPYANNSDNAVAIAVRKAGVAYDPVGIPALPRGTMGKFAIAVSDVDGNGLRFFINGVKCVNATNPSMTLTGGQLSFPVNMPFTLRNLRIYRKPLTDTQLISLTS